MASACSSETDPRPKLAAFVSDSTVRSIGGNRTEGLESLMDLVREEVLRQDPETQIIILDRDFMSRNKVLFARDLGTYLCEKAFGIKTAVFLTEHLPIINWQEALSYLTEDTQVYYGSLACRQIPTVVKLL